MNTNLTNLSAWKDAHKLHTEPVYLFIYKPPIEHINLSTKNKSLRRDTTNTVQQQYSNQDVPADDELR